jgi:aminoglycoside/choline kinase family phosphotransferase
MTPPRPELRRSIENEHPGATLAPLAGDASTRAFFRLLLEDGSSRVVMDYGAPFEEETDDVRLARVFEAASLPVPRIFRVEPSIGYLVLQDLGDRTLESELSGVAGNPVLREAPVRRAVELCISIATRGTPALAASDRAGGPALDPERFRFEMDFFLQHYVLGLLGAGSVPVSVRRTLMDLADLAAAGPRVLCHRDFHSRNLMVQEDGSLAMVDFQDARWGPDTYDMASLLRDAYVDHEEGLAGRMLDLYTRTLPGASDPAGLRERFAWVGMERSVKALGTFGYQTHVLGRTRYVTAIRRVLAHLERDAAADGGASAVARELKRAGFLEIPSGI